MQTRRYSSKPVNALQVGNPAYAIELKARQSQQRAKPMTLSSLAVDPFGVNTLQAFYPGKVRSAKNYRSTFSSFAKSSTAKSTGSCSKCSGKSEKSEESRSNYSNPSLASSASSRNSSVAQLNRMSQTELADFVLNLEQKVAQSCGDGSPASQATPQGNPQAGGNQAPAPNQTTGSSCCCCTCSPAPQTIAPQTQDWSQTNSASPPGSNGSSNPGALENYTSIPSLIQQALPQGEGEYTPGYNPLPGGISYNKQWIPRGF